MAETSITPLDNGPYAVKGEFQVLSPDGTVIETRGDAYLCRCGASTNKPFCDGTHSKIGFAAAARAVEEADNA
jgi:CDGSH-type Zn-finger protein